MTTDNTTNKYKATFEVPALVRIEIELDAANQQEGLVTAHDLIHQAMPGQATIVSLSLDRATNTAFERIESNESTPAVPASPVSQGRYRVELFAGKELSQPAAVKPHLPYGDAKALAESVLAELSPYGSARVTDEFGVVVLRTTALRGGFEVHAYSATDDEKTVPEVGSNRLFTWLATLQEAKRTALDLMKRTGITLVRIVDFSDRQAGPRVHREIR